MLVLNSLPQATENSEFASCDAICEATYFEKHVLWQKYFKDTTITYKDNGGYAVVVGKIDGENCCISASFVEVNNKKICYWEPLSNLINHVMIRKFLESKTKTSIVKENPQHFHYILDQLGIDFRTAKVK